MAVYYEVIYRVPKFAPHVIVYDECDYEKALSVYTMKSGCKTNAGETTELVRSENGVRKVILPI